MSVKKVEINKEDKSIELDEDDLQALNSYYNIANLIESNIIEEEEHGAGDNITTKAPGKT